jgi:hypothetical protein
MTRTRSSRARAPTRKLADDEYHVEKILDTRMLPRKPREYLVKWEAYPITDATWEPESNLAGSRGSVREYMDTLERLTHRQRYRSGQRHKAPRGNVGGENKNDVVPRTRHIQCVPSFVGRTSMGGVITDTSRGIYALTPEDILKDDGPDRKYRVKIGLGGGYHSGDCGGLAKRIDSYHTAYPDGVQVLAILEGRTRANVMALEMAVKDLLDTNVHNNYITSTRIIGEWYFVTLKTLYDAFKRVHRENRELCWGVAKYPK